MSGCIVTHWSDGQTDVLADGRLALGPCDVVSLEFSDAQREQLAAVGIVEPEHLDILAQAVIAADAAAHPFERHPDEPRLSRRERVAARKRAGLADVRATAGLGDVLAPLLAALADCGIRPSRSRSSRCWRGLAVLWPLAAAGRAGFERTLGRVLHEAVPQQPRSRKPPPPPPRAPELVEVRPGVRRYRGWRY